MNWKTTSIFFMGFSAGMVYTVACSNNDKGGDSGIPGVGDANADEGEEGDDDTSGLASQITDLTSQLADLSTQLADMAIALAASEAAIVQLQSETLRWEIVEYTCSGVSYENTGISTDGIVALTWGYIDDDDPSEVNWNQPSVDSQDGMLEVNCGYDADSLVTFTIALGYQR